MSIKIKYKDPKSTDFGPNDIVINVQEGTLFYKSENGIFKLQGNNLNSSSPSENIINFPIVSASKGFFNSPGIGGLIVEGEGVYRFKVGHYPTLEVGGHILPLKQDAPMYDLGGELNPWRKLYVAQSSIHFVQTGRGVGFSPIENGFIIESYREFTDPTPDSETRLTKTNIDDLKSGKSIVSESKNITATGQAESVDGVTNYIRPEVIYHPTDDESAILHKTIGRLSYRSPGGDPFEIYADGGSNDYIRLGSTTTNATSVIIPSNITASGTIRGKEIHILNTAFKDNIADDEVYVPWNSTTETTVTSNLNTPFIAPCSGRLLKIKYKSNLDNSGATATWRIRAVSVGDGISTGNATILATATCTGPAAGTETATADFTAVSQTEFAADDMLLITIQHNTDLAQEKIYWVTAVFQLNYNTLGY